ncbi:DUF5643 domain-containing protein [Clostridium hydrogenum]|uniref:DUF5643 domain-containing protein n=1 Tax=Clostridium hydrogenum TaxID=2855764 RepID=UPI002E378D4F|nr:DUF5643 domain-containing protein [Clostridium hydrogenum]
MKKFRRTIIIICSILLIPIILTSIPSGKYLNSYWKKIMIGENAKVIEVNKKWKIDNASIIIQRVIITDKHVYIRARYVSLEIGWSFDFGSIEMYDDKGKRYFNSTGEGRGKLWGGEEITQYEKVPKDCKEITLRLQCYDRKAELKIPCKGGKNI